MTKENARAGVNTKETSVCGECMMCSSLFTAQGRGEEEEGRGSDENRRKG